MKQLVAGTFIAFLILFGNVQTEGTEVKVSNVETALQIENWMIDETVWITNTLNAAEFIQETEPVLELATWMTNDETWNLNSSFIEETETELELEDWMTSEETWNKENNSNESELTVESWMICNNVWK